MLFRSCFILAFVSNVIDGKNEATWLSIDFSKVDIGDLVTPIIKCVALKGCDKWNSFGNVTYMGSYDGKYSKATTEDNYVGWLGNSKEFNMNDVLARTESDGIVGVSFQQATEIKVTVWDPDADPTLETSSFSGIELKVGTNVIRTKFNMPVEGQTIAERPYFAIEHQTKYTQAANGSVAYDEENGELVITIEVTEEQMKTIKEANEENADTYKLAAYLQVNSSDNSRKFTLVNEKYTFTISE